MARSIALRTTLGEPTYSPLPLAYVIHVELAWRLLQSATSIASLHTLIGPHDLEGVEQPGNIVPRVRGNRNV